MTDFAQKSAWRAQINARDGRRPKLEPEERPWIGPAEDCVICDEPTRHWLQPENVPLCPPPKDCLEEYMKNPSVWDPRRLHVVKKKVLKWP